MLWKKKEKKQFFVLETKDKGLYGPISSNLLHLVWLNFDIYSVSCFSNNLFDIDLNISLGIHAGKKLLWTFVPCSYSKWSVICISYLFLLTCNPLKTLVLFHYYLKDIYYHFPSWFMLRLQWLSHDSQGHYIKLHKCSMNNKFSLNFLTTSWKELVS